MKSARWFISYLVVAFVGLGLAFTLSLRFLSPAHSQTDKQTEKTKLEAPSAGDLPAEFLNEVKKTEVPSAVAPAATPMPAAKSAKSADPSAQLPPPAAAFSDGSAEATAPAPVTPVIASPGEEYIYDPTGRRDPFAPPRALPSLRVKEATAGKQPAGDPLQRWDIERFKVVGILWEVKSPRAMLRDPDGLVYTVVKNTKLGRNNGYVAAIREGEVVVVETNEYEGTTNKETKILELGK